MKKYSNAAAKNGFTRVPKIAESRSRGTVSSKTFGRKSLNGPNLRKAVEAWRHAASRDQLDPDVIWRNTRAKSAGRALPFED